MAIDSSLLTFPCDFSIKVIGYHSANFEQSLLTLLNKHFHPLKENCIQQRPSRQGKYLAYTLNVYAENQTQLNHFYQELQTCPDVVMAL